MQHKEQQGFLTIAANTDQVNYLQLAYVQALSIKATQKIKNVAVIVDQKTKQDITEKHQQVFDYIIDAPITEHGPFAIEPLAFYLTPFKETVKLEADILLTRSIDHWWNSFRQRDMVLSTGCRDYQQLQSTSRKYRKLFDDNFLPDIYSGLMYFRYTQTAANFFKHARQVFEYWNTVVTEIKNCDEQYASTDLAYAIVANIIGRENCTLPSMDFINFVHMKPGINNFPEEFEFTDIFVTEFCDQLVRINGINQLQPLHYYQKNFITQEVIEHYECLAGID